MEGVMRRVAGAVARTPALHFLVLGAALAWLDAAGGTRIRHPAGADRHHGGARRRDPRRLRRATWRPRPPTSSTALVARDADEEMLYREALALGLDRGDGAVKWRIVEKMHFLFGDDAGDAEAAYRRGVALGLARDDVVVRNALVTKMRLSPKRRAGPKSRAAPRSSASSRRISRPIGDDLRAGRAPELDPGLPERRHARRARSRRTRARCADASRASTRRRRTPRGSATRSSPAARSARRRRAGWRRSFGDGVRRPRSRSSEPDAGPSRSLALRHASGVGRARARPRSCRRSTRSARGCCRPTAPSAARSISAA